MAATVRRCRRAASNAAARKASRVPSALTTWRSACRIRAAMAERASTRTAHTSKFLSYSSVRLFPPVLTPNKTRCCWHRSRVFMIITHRRCIVTCPGQFGDLSGWCRIFAAPHVLCGAIRRTIYERPISPRRFREMLSGPRQHDEDCSIVWIYDSAANGGRLSIRQRVHVDEHCEHVLRCCVLSP